MSAGVGHSEFRSITFDLITYARRLARLRIDDQHIGNVDPRFLVDNPAATIARRLLMPLDHSSAFHLHLATGRRHGEHATTLALVASGDQDHLVVLLNLRSLSGFHNQITS